MKRHFDTSDDDLSANQSSKFSRNFNNSRKIVSFQPNETESMNSLTTKLKSHQSTPYPNRIKFKQLQQDTNEDNEVVSTDKTIEISEKRNPEFLNKLGSLNRSFIRWIDIYFNKGYNYDFTPVCNDYIRFINNLKERYPIEIGGQDTNSSLKNDKPFENESSPIKSKLNFNSQQQFLNTPPQISGDKEYKLTPYPKHLINSNKQDSEFTTDKLISNKSSEPSTASSNKFEFQSQQNFTSTNSTDNSNLKNDQKKVFKFPTTFQSDKSSSNDIFKFGIDSNTTNQQTATISKNLFDAKPINNLAPAKDVLNSIKPIDNNFFSPENIFKTQSTEVSKSVDQSIQQQLNNSSAIGSANLASNVSTTGNDDDENYVPPKPENIFVEENASYSVKCKLFLKKADSYIEKGVGTLYIKETNEESGNQLLIRGHNSLGTIMLNIRLKKSLPVQATKNGILLTCVPNPPIEGKFVDETASFYIKVRSSEVGQELMTFIEKYSK